ncbi:MAG: phosphate ABC transporter ATP-binding protein [Chloroflexi bacterium HGW-Chloroflexi-10]|nr:MAG: phosphate ABC transporter ATP-binding protein [Chloroflexi bacterium HGW-Chloroflexi-10]
MEAHIQTKDLNVFYGKSIALSNVNIKIPRQQLTVIMGPSGCGKTTLLKSFNRFLELNESTRIEGDIYLDNVNLYHPGVNVIDIRKKIGLLAQRPFPLPMSIFNNVAYGLRIHGMVKSRKETYESVKKYLEIASLWEEVKDRLNDPASELSIGQQQRLCLARGLAVEPEIILGDEPTSALDPISAALVEQLLIELKQKYTTIIVTHTLRQAKRLADYVIFMYLGEVVEQGPAREMFSNPKQERTKAFLAGVF